MDLIKDVSGVNKVCPVYRFAAIFESKWSLVILRDLFMKGPLRFRDFKINTPTLTDRALNQTLKRLQVLKLITRKVQDTSPPSVVYELSHYGQGLHPVIMSMVEWSKSQGQKWWKEIRTEYGSTGKKEAS